MQLISHKKIAYIIIILTILLTSGCTHYSSVGDSAFNRDIKYKLKEYTEINAFEVTSGPLFIGIDIKLEDELDKDEVFLKLIPMLSEYELTKFIKKKYRKYGEANVKISFELGGVYYMYFNKYDKERNSEYKIWEYRATESNEVYLYTVYEEDEELLINKEVAEEYRGY